MQPRSLMGQQQGAAPRRHPGSQRPHTHALMTTEYKERYHPPQLYKRLVSTVTQKPPHHPLKGSPEDVTTFKSVYLAQKRTKNPPKVPKPSTPKVEPRSYSAPLRLGRNLRSSKVEDFTSVYQNDFRVWTICKRQPYKLTDNLKVSQGLSVPSRAAKASPDQRNCVCVDADPQPMSVTEGELQPCEKITSYKADYIPYPVQAKVTPRKPATHTRKDMLTWDPKLFNNASEFYDKFKSWSIDTKDQSRGKTKDSGLSESTGKFMSTTHVDYKAHPCQRTQPIIQKTQNFVRSTEPLSKTTTMKEDFKAWGMSSRLPVIPKKQLNGPLSMSTPDHTESSKTKIPLKFHPKLSETAICKSLCSATQGPQCPAENGVISSFEYISKGNEESRKLWTTSLNRGVTWSKDHVCEEPCEAHPLSCMVASKS